MKKLASELNLTPTFGRMRTFGRISGEARRMPFTQLKGEVLEEFRYQVQNGILRRSTPQLDMCGSG